MLCAQVVIDPPLDGRRIVHKAASNEYFRLGLREADFLESLDGSRDREALIAANERTLTGDEVSYLLGWFEEKRLLEGSDPPGSAARLVWWRRMGALIANTQQWRVRLASPDAFLARHRSVVDALFSLPAMIAYACIVFLPVALLIVAPERVMHRLWTLDPALPTWGWIQVYIALLATNVLHEMAHAAACKHYGGRVERIGVMLMYLQPVLYCDVSDSWRFPDTRHKIVVAAAGLVLQLVLAALAGTAWVFSGAPVLYVFAAVNLALIVLNLIPFVKLDGYWMLVHKLGEPNLRQKGLEAVDIGMRRLLGRRDDRAVRPAVAVFAVGHVIAVPTFWIIGLSSLYRYSSHVSLPFAYGMVALFGLPLAIRFLRAAAAWLRSTLAQPQVAR
jgi:putative peptide zinc metalloprotease protein